MFQWDLSLDPPEQRKAAIEQQRRTDSEESKRNEVLHNNIGF